MSTLIEHEQYDVLYTKGNNTFTVEEVHVTSDGKTVSYKLQEHDAEDEPIGDPDWYDASQIKPVTHGVWQIVKDEADKSAGEMGEDV